MLRVGLTGGIGAGKSAVARRLAERGAVLIDSDVLAREVVAPGTEGLAAVVVEFGSTVLTSDGQLDRAALAKIVFADPDARQRLNEIVHPLVGLRSHALIGSAPADAVVVQDVPLLVENSLAPMFHLVIVVHAAVAERVRRLRSDRGMTDAEARSRIAAQSDDAARGAAADVWLENTGAVPELLSSVDRLWTQRLLPFEANLRLGRPVADGEPRLTSPDPTWPHQAARLSARAALACGVPPAQVQHVGSTAVPGLLARDIVDLALLAESAGAVRAALGEAGFPACTELVHDELTHGGADPGRLVHLQICAPGSAQWRRLLLTRDWLHADPAARAEYASLKRRLTAPSSEKVDGQRYQAEKQAWLIAAQGRMEQWVASVWWRPTAAADRV